MLYEFKFIAGCENKSMDLVFLLDTSINNTKDYHIMQNFLFDFVDNVDIDSGSVRIAMVTFSTGANIQFRLNDHKSTTEVKQGIQNAYFYPGERNTADAFDALRRKVFFEIYGDRPDVPDIVMFLTTGISDRNAHRTLQEADALHYFDVNFMVVGIGEFDSTEMESIANSPTDQYLSKISQMNELASVTDKILKQVCRCE